MNRFNGWCQIGLTLATVAWFFISTWYGYKGA